MFRQDYIIRMIEQFGQVLRQIVGLNKAGNFEDARNVIASTTEELVGFNLEEVCATADAKLVSKLIKGQTPPEARERCFMLVTLLTEAGDNFAGLEQLDKRRACLLKALNLHLAIGSFADEEVVPDYAPKLDRLIDLAKEEGLPARSLIGLMQFHESHGQYGKAEDRLFELIEAIDQKKPALDLGVAFFHRLLAKPEEILESGGLPRAEVEQGLAELDRIHVESA